MNSSSDNNYVSLVRIPRKWFYVFVWTFSGLLILNLFIELALDWKWQAFGETLPTRMAALMTLIVGWFFIVSHVLEVIMLGYAKLFRERVYAEGKAEGKAEGRAEGRTEGRTELFNELLEAQRKGIPLEKALEAYAAKNGYKTNGTDTDPND